MTLWQVKVWLRKHGASDLAAALSVPRPEEGRLEEVRFFLWLGETPHWVARKLGVEPVTLAMWLERQGARDLASRFYEAERQAYLEKPVGSSRLRPSLKEDAA